MYEDLRKNYKIIRNHSDLCGNTIYLVIYYKLYNTNRPQDSGTFNYSHYTQ